MARSGTEFLSGLLASTGRVGLAREWFHPKRMPEGGDLNVFVSGVVAERSFRGRFGVKFIDHQLWQFLAALRSLHEAGGSTDRELLTQAFPNPSFVWVKRRNTIAQAVSFWKALQTGQWWIGAGLRAAPSAGPVFDFEGIDQRVAEIALGEERWKRWFDENRITPLEVVYEELDANPVEETRRVLVFLGDDLPPRAGLRTRTARQRDALNDEWIAHYHAIASTRSPWPERMI
jgi:LPS sulfotransferase NodH